MSDGSEREQAEREREAKSRLFSFEYICIFISCIFVVPYAKSYSINLDYLSLSLIARKVGRTGKVDAEGEKGREREGKRGHLPKFGRDGCTVLYCCCTQFYSLAAFIILLGVCMSR